MYQFLTTKQLADTYTFIVDESQLSITTYLFIFIYNHLKVNEDEHYITWDTHSDASRDVVLIVTGERAGSPTLHVDLALRTLFLWLCYWTVLRSHTHFTTFFQQHSTFITEATYEKNRSPIKKHVNSAGH